MPNTNLYLIAKYRKLTSSNVFPNGEIVKIGVEIGNWPTLYAGKVHVLHVHLSKVSVCEI